MVNYYSLTNDECLKAVDSSINGLSSKEALLRLRDNGFNEFKEEKGFNWIFIFLRQFTNWLVILLIIAGILSLFVGEMIDSIAILIIILLNSLFGFFQEYKAERAIEALQKMTKPFAKVIRNNVVIKIPSRELVVGDVILLGAGDIVPADCRLIDISDLKVNEASLTGESVEVEKIIDSLGSNLKITSQKNMIFMNTSISYGRAKALVVFNVQNSEFGKITKTISETKEQDTPLQIKFKQLSKQISFVFMFLIGIVFFIGLLFNLGTLNKLFLFALALAVAVIPESLPIIVTISLALGARRLAFKNMLIKKLSATESLGSTTIICSDKTGTLTKDEMTVTRIFSSGRIINVSGVGYAPIGEFFLDGKTLDVNRIEVLLKAAFFCNNSHINKIDGQYKIIGDSTEGALAVMVQKSELFKNESLFKGKLLHEFSFSSERKLMSVVMQVNKKIEVFVKGAPEILLSKCSHVLINGKVVKLDDKHRKEILEVNNKFALDALRVIGLAYRDVSKLKKFDAKDVEKDLIFAGLVGMIDPPRDEVHKALIDCSNAGIKVMMITGDHLLTAKSIAHSIGLFKEGDLALTGSDLDEMSDSDLERLILRIRVIARILPIQKLRIVSVLQKLGEVVAVTGDGVNDAPALKKADIGIAMGITGTDVSKQVAKAVLADDNFATIVNAIFEGRNIYDKILKSTKYLLSCNIGEVLTVLFAVLFRLPLILLPLQILMMNLLTDNLPSLGLGFENAERGIMLRKPRSKNENPINLKMLISMSIFGFVMALGTLILFFNFVDVNINHARTIAFTTLVMFQMFAVINSRSLKFDISALNLFSNIWLFLGVLIGVFLQLLVVYFEPLQKVFGTVALSSNDWLLILIFSFVGCVVMELSKFFIAKERKESLY